MLSLHSFLSAKASTDFKNANGEPLLPLLFQALAISNFASCPEGLARA